MTIVYLFWMREKDSGFILNSRNRCCIYTPVVPLFVNFPHLILSLSKINDKYTIFFANSLWMHYRFRDFIWIHYLSRVFTMNALSSSRIQKNRLALSRFYYKYAFYITNSILIYYLYRDFTLKMLYISRFHCVFAIFIGKSI